MGDRKTKSATCGSAKLYPAIASRTAMTLIALAGTLLACASLGVSVASAAGRPSIGGGGEIQVTHTTQTEVIFFAGIQANGLATSWRFEYSETNSGPWQLVPGGTGTIPGETGNEYTRVNASLTGLSPGTKYYVRLTATNADGEAVAVESFSTNPLHPRAFCCMISSVSAGAAHIHGQVIPDDFETHWQIEYSSSRSRSVE